MKTHTNVSFKNSLLNAGKIKEHCITVVSLSGWMFFSVTDAFLANMFLSKWWQRFILFLWSVSIQEFRTWF